MTTDPIEPKCREQGSEFLPKFDSNGLLSAVVTHAETAEVLMVAFMDRDALDATIASGEAHFHSRSRGRLWKKGESSGHVLKVAEIGEVIRLLRSRGDMAIVLVEQYFEWARDLCDSYAVMDRGQVVLAGPRAGMVEADVLRWMSV